ncbi:MAG: PAS domain-containing protein [Candidatus Ozemobacteraceae bacterium]
MDNGNKTSGDAADIRRQAEEIVREKAALFPENTESPSSPIKDSAGSPEEMRRMLHELRVHETELEMQNEELRRTQIELDAVRERYFELYDLAPVGYCTISKLGIVLETNLTAAALLGLTRSELVKRPISRFILKDDQDIFYRYSKKLIETGEPESCELQMMKMDGTPFWACLASIMARNADGEPVLRVVMSEITIRKRAEEAQRSSEEEYRNLFLLSPYPILIFVDGKTVFANREFLKLVGVTNGEEVLGKPVLDILHPDLIDPEKRCMSIYWTMQETLPSAEYKIRRQDGSYVGVGITSVQITFGMQPAIHVTLREITERKPTEAGQERIPGNSA